MGVELKMKKAMWTRSSLRKFGMKEPAIKLAYANNRGKLFWVEMDDSGNREFAVQVFSGVAIACKGHDMPGPGDQTMTFRQEADGHLWWGEPPSKMSEDLASELLFLAQLCLCDGEAAEEPASFHNARVESSGPWPQDSFEIKVNLGNKALYEDVHTGKIWLMMRDDNNVPKIETKSAVNAVEIEAETIGHGAALRLVASLNCGGSFHWIPWWSLSSVLEALDCEPVFYESATNHLSHIKEYL